MNLRIFDNAADLIQAAACMKAMSPRASARALVARVARRPSSRRLATLGVTTSNEPAHLRQRRRSDSGRRLHESDVTPSVSEGPGGAGGAPSLPPGASLRSA